MSGELTVLVVSRDDALIGAVRAGLKERADYRVVIALKQVSVWDHLLVDIMRLVCGVASAFARWFFV